MSTGSSYLIKIQTMHAKQKIEENRQFNAQSCRYSFAFLVPLTSRR